jgi:hypothetical protein
MERLTLVPIFLSATDCAKDTAEEFETAKPERRHLQQHSKSSSAWYMMMMMMVWIAAVTV